MANSFQYDSDNELDVDVIDCTLHDKLTWDQLQEIKNIFFKNNKALDQSTLRETLELFNIDMTNEQYKKLFLKVNLDRNDVINWDEFTTYLIYSFKHDDSHSQQEALILPISIEPVAKKACHKTAIIDISLLQSFGEDQESFGSYLTVSKDGFVNFWTPELEINKSGTSKSQYLNYTPTWVLGIIALSDVRVICISSTERELRFYDVMATNFHLRLVIRSIPYAVCKLNYFFTTSQMDINSKLLMGDMNGNAYTIEFSPILRGPFQSKAGALLMEFTWSQLIKKKFSSIIATEYLNLFTQFITEISYSLRFDTLYISAEGHGHSGGLLGIDNRGMRTHYLMPQGVSAFTLDEQNRVLATGGPDTFIRLWDPLLPLKASAVLSGHHAGIIYIFIQPDEQKCYSIDKAKIIKVWHLIEYSLIQSYSGLLLVIPNEISLCYMYNKAGHELLVGGRKLVSVKCCLKVKLELTDGYTHTAGISVVLYNHLFENIVTCGLDSYIIVWDIWTGRRQIIMKGCHTQTSMGETIDLEITAATFDPERQYLLTGARDGSLKVWNYNNAVCVRNMNIEIGCEVTAVIWVVDRILAVGWNRRVTEFAASYSGHYSDPKKWDGVHVDDISAAAFKNGQTVVTGSSSGELVLWKMDTGQPYRKYDVAQPELYIPLVMDPKLCLVGPTRQRRRQPAISALKLGRHSVSKILTSRYRQRRNTVDEQVRDASVKLNIVKKHIMRRLDSRGVIMPLPVAREPSEDLEKKRIGVLAILFLKTRPQSKNYGSVLVSLDNGYLQVYSHHQLGGYMKEFYSIHKSGDYCLSLATDKTNKYLFTGTAFGYLKVWLMQNYCIPVSKHTHVCMPLLRLQFVFLVNERILGRAKRVARNKEPFLLNSYKAHICGITTIVYIDHSKILITGSSDYSARMWTLSGRYLGTFGGSVPRKILKRSEAIDDYNDTFRIPPDINKVASSTTLKVLTGKPPDRLGDYVRKSLEEERLVRDIDLNEFNLDKSSTISSTIRSGKIRTCIANPLKTPVLGKHFKINEEYNYKIKPILDKTLPHIPVYTHLKIHDAKIIPRPRTPEKLKLIQNINLMEQYKSKKK